MSNASKIKSANNNVNSNVNINARANTNVNGMEILKAKKKNKVLLFSTGGNRRGGQGK